MKKRTWVLTALLAGVMAAVMLTSVVFLTVKSDHDCAGEDCAVCQQLCICESILKSLGLAAAVTAAAGAFRSAFCRAILACAKVVPPVSPVSLKVKLTN